MSSKKHGINISKHFPLGLEVGCLNLGKFNIPSPPCTPPSCFQNLNCPPSNFYVGSNFDQPSDFANGLSDFGAGSTFNPSPNLNDFFFNSWNEYYDAMGINQMDLQSLCSNIMPDQDLSGYFNNNLIQNDFSYHQNILTPNCDKLDLPFDLCQNSVFPNSTQMNIPNLLNQNFMFQRTNDSKDFYGIANELQSEEPCNCKACCLLPMALQTVNNMGAQICSNFLNSSRLGGVALNLQTQNMNTYPVGMYTSHNVLNNIIPSSNLIPDIDIYSNFSNVNNRPTPTLNNPPIYSSHLLNAPKIPIVNNHPIYSSHLLNNPMAPTLNNPPIYSSHLFNTPNIPIANNPPIYSSHFLNGPPKSTQIYGNPTLNNIYGNHEQISSNTMPRVNPQFPSNFESVQQHSNIYGNISLTPPTTSSNLTQPNVFAYPNKTSNAILTKNNTNNQIFQNLATVNNRLAYSFSNDKNLSTPFSNVLSNSQTYIPDRSNNASGVNFNETGIYSNFANTQQKASNIYTSHLSNNFLQNSQSYANNSGSQIIYNDHQQPKVQVLSRPLIRSNPDLAPLTPPQKSIEKPLPPTLMSFDKNAVFTSSRLDCNGLLVNDKSRGVNNQNENNINIARNNMHQNFEINLQLNQPTKLSSPNNQIYRNFTNYGVPFLNSRQSDIKAEFSNIDDMYDLINDLIGDEQLVKELTRELNLNNGKFKVVSHQGSLGNYNCYGLLENKKINTNEANKTVNKPLMSPMPISANVPTNLKNNLYTKPPPPPLFRSSTLFKEEKFKENCSMPQKTITNTSSRLSKEIVTNRYANKPTIHKDNQLTASFLNDFSVKEAYGR